MLVYQRVTIGTSATIVPWHFFHSHPLQYFNSCLPCGQKHQPLFPDHRLMPLFKHVENMLMILALTRSLCSGLKQFKSDCFMSERSNGLGFHTNLVELEHPSSSTNVALVQFMGLPAGRKNIPLFQVLQFELLVAASWLMLLPAAIWMPLKIWMDHTHKTLPFLSGKWWSSSCRVPHFQANPSASRNLLLILTCPQCLSKGAVDNATGTLRTTPTDTNNNTFSHSMFHSRTLACSTPALQSSILCSLKDSWKFFLVVFQGWHLVPRNCFKLVYGHCHGEYEAIQLRHLSSTQLSPRKTTCHDDEHTWYHQLSCGCWRSIRPKVEWGNVCERIDPMLSHSAPCFIADLAESWIFLPILKNRTKL